MANVNGKEYELVTDLARLLRKSGDKILNGESKLSLTTQSLSLLNVAFRRYSETGSGQVETTRGKKNVKGEERLQNFRTNAQYLHDFITKTVSLKIIHGTNTMQGAILISRFRNLQVLELKKVPIHMLEGLQKLRSQLQCVIVSRSLQNLQDLFETCGGDMSAPMSWPEMKSVYLSYNGLSKLDGSLYLTEILRLNIGYNFMDSVPTFSLSAKSKLRTLVLRNNNLDNLEGIDELVLLEELDVSENCLVDHSCLVVLNGLNKLYMLGLQGNPLSFHRSHRSLTLQHISPAAGKNEFILDNKKITVAEMMSTLIFYLTLSITSSHNRSSVHFIIDLLDICYYNYVTGAEKDKLSYNCPKCGSGMVVELDVVQKPKSRQTTPKDSLQSTPKGSRQSTPKGSYTSSNFTNAMATEKISPIKSLVKDEGLIEPEKIPKSHKLNDLKVDESETYEEQNTDITELVQSTAFSEHSKLEGISKYNATTLENLQITLLPWKQVEDEEVDIVKYLMCYLVTESGTDGANSEPVSIVVTYTDMFLVKENHQWPIPRLQAPLNDEIKGQQFLC
ncbi:hypothetical protein KUTeg_015563 [Tegillarca granosa]|uniref:LKB1 serine/threonine kinase interacting protein 1 N-terminal domain-containing protein n=1 Tax=Tegillarca granosa TaxID=220873 RepID=A0ABQ9EQH2_TEGGR|nr:hypothetical protein KUTeg_015563 [Tegillarca granosa]